MRRLRRITDMTSHLSCSCVLPICSYFASANTFVSLPYYSRFCLFLVTKLESHSGRKWGGTLSKQNLYQNGIIRSERKNKKGCHCRGIRQLGATGLTLSWSHWFTHNPREGNEARWFVSIFFAIPLYPMGLLGERRRFIGVGGILV